MSDITNTVIVTSRDDDVLSQVDYLQHWLYDNVLSEFLITAQDPIQLIVLRKFQRILIVAPSTAISQRIRCAAMSRSLCRSYAPLNTSASVEHLEVPKSERMFLISPPTSPPPEFDYSRCEEPPSGPLSEHHHLNPQQSAVPITILNSSFANITVHPCEENPTNDPQMDSYQRTALPPKSIFDSDDE